MITVSGTCSGGEPAVIVSSGPGAGDASAGAPPNMGSGRSHRPQHRRTQGRTCVRPLDGGCQDGPPTDPGPPEQHVRAADRRASRARAAGTDLGHGPRARTRARRCRVRAGPRPLRYDTARREAATTGLPRHHCPTRARIRAITARDRVEQRNNVRGPHRTIRGEPFPPTPPTTPRAKPSRPRGQPPATGLSPAPPPPPTAAAPPRPPPAAAARAPSARRACACTPCRRAARGRARAAA